MPLTFSGVVAGLAVSFSDVFTFMLPANGGSGYSVANLAVVLGFVPGFAAFAYMGGLIWFLLVSAIQFIMLVFLHVRSS